MKAALIARYGRNDLVTVAETAIPAFGSMDLLVQVHAASVNPVLVSVEFTSRQAPLVLKGLENGFGSSLLKTSFRMRFDGKTGIEHGDANGRSSDGRELRRKR